MAFQPFAILKEACPDGDFILFRMDTYGSLLLRAQHALGSLLGSLDSISGLVLPGVRTIGVDIGGLSHNWDLLVSGQLIGGNDREQGEGKDL